MNIPINNNNIILIKILIINQYLSNLSDSVDTIHQVIKLEIKILTSNSIQKVIIVFDIVDLFSLPKQLTNNKYLLIFLLIIKNHKIVLVIKNIEVIVPKQFHNILFDLANFMIGGKQFSFEMN